MEKNKFEQKSLTAKNWGYRLYPHLHSHVSSYSKIEVNLQAEPTGRHFDPEQVHLTCLSDTGDPEPLIVSQPWSLAKEYQVVVGRIFLSDRVGETVTFFTYGGLLRIENFNDLTVCTIVSPAPILHPLRFTGVAAILADQTEILLAERRAQDLPDLVNYDHYVASTTPAELYLQTLRLLEQKMGQGARINVSYIGEFLDFLRLEFADFRKMSVN